MTAPAFAPNDHLDLLAEEIRGSYRGHLHEVRIEAAAGGLILHGRAATFYGKQVALHEARRRSGRAVLANRIAVG